MSSSADIHDGILPTDQSLAQAETELRFRTLLPRLREATVISTIASALLPLAKFRPLFSDAGEQGRKAVFLDMSDTQTGQKLQTLLQEILEQKHRKSIPKGGMNGLCEVVARITYQKSLELLSSMIELQLQPYDAISLEDIGIPAVITNRPEGVHRGEGTPLSLMEIDEFRQQRLRALQERNTASQTGTEKELSVEQTIANAVSQVLKSVPSEPIISPKTNAES